MVEDYWKTSVTILGNDKVFLDKLRNYDKDNINPKGYRVVDAKGYRVDAKQVIARIREKYLTDENFTPEKATNASSAAAGLCKWVGAMDKYDVVAKVVAPKQAELAVAEAAYEEVMTGLRAKQAELKGLLDKLAAMEDELKENTDKKNKLEAEVCYTRATRWMLRATVWMNK
eukprot:1188686-Prorocentrum_minimum.AAC.3